ncbi:MAG: murein transglycosylase A [Magnetospirillum sp.]|nr:murein transglycosylase A [Magnetospirillum sp.]
MRRLVLGAMLLLAGCAAPPPAPPPPSKPLADRLVLSPARFEDLPGWRRDSAAAALPAFLKSCERITRMPFDASIGAQGVGGVAADWMGACGAARRVPPGDDGAARAFFEQWFTPWQAANNGKADGLFTGYYEPELNGSRVRHGPYTVPLLARPGDLVTFDPGSFRPDLPHEQLAGRVMNGRLEPYPARAAIESGALGDLARPLVWLDDPVDAHILHIQGSGRVKLDDGTVVRVGVAATNGRPFVGIGKLLADKGKLPAGSSMPVIRAWLRAHPDEAGALMDGNPRYVFYRMVPGDGPVGTEGVVLTAQRSLAVDTRFLPLGAPLWLDTVTPKGVPLRRIVVAQDTGAAIRGPVRGDLFWGTGDAAFDMAGGMKSPGRYWLLLPRERSPRLAAAGAD